MVNLASASSRCFFERIQVISRTCRPRTPLCPWAWSPPLPGLRSLFSGPVLYPQERTALPTATPRPWPRPGSTQIPAVQQAEFPVAALPAVDSTLLLHSRKAGDRVCECLVYGTWGRGHDLGHSVRTWLDSSSHSSCSFRLCCSCGQGPGCLDPSASLATPGPTFCSCPYQVQPVLLRGLQ